jgi:hypothetical protein
VQDEVGVGQRQRRVHLGEQHRRRRARVVGVMEDPPRALFVEDAAVGIERGRMAFSAGVQAPVRVSRWRRWRSTRSDSWRPGARCRYADLTGGRRPTVFDVRGSALDAPIKPEPKAALSNGIASNPVERTLKSQAYETSL